VRRSPLVTVPTPAASPVPMEPPTTPCCGRKWARANGETTGHPATLPGCHYRKVGLENYEPN